MVEFESLGERNAAVVLERAPEILSYVEQPPKEPWFDGDRIRRYTADFHVLTTLGAVWLEIKPSEIARRPKIRQRHRSIKTSFAARGMPFVVWTECHVANPNRAIAMLLAAARRGRRFANPIEAKGDRP